MKEYIARHSPDVVTAAINQALESIGDQKHEFVGAAARRLLLEDDREEITERDFIVDDECGTLSLLPIDHGANHLALAGAGKVAGNETVGDPEAKRWSDQLGFSGFATPSRPKA